MAVILPPLLSGSTGGGSLRSDWRKLEDKFTANCKVELRQFVVNLDVEEVHKNRELPSAYICWLGVPDTTLPKKGTAHRALRGQGQAAIEETSGVNVLLVYIFIL